MTAVERGGSGGGGGAAAATEGGGTTGEGGGATTATDGDGAGQPPPKKPPELTPRPGTPAAPTAVAAGAGGGAGGKLLCDTDAGDPDDQEDDEILEESPCKRWSKRREKVKQRDVPGIDAAYLAMDNETGNEVVWNEVLFSERKNFREQEEKIRAVFDNLVRLEHPNLVKFHKYWMDTKSDKPRIIFITEYMSSGSMSRFLQRARSSGSLLNIKAWKSWTRQILTALSYLHSCDPPIVHANLTCNSVFIQQNGLVKIGCVAPKTIHHYVKTFRENIKNVHYLAPEYDHQTETTIQADIYSFGVCALEMATTGALQSGCFNGASSGMASSVGVATGTTPAAIPSVASFTSLPPHATTAPTTCAERDKGGATVAENGPLSATTSIGCSLASAASSSTLPGTINNGSTTTTSAPLPQSAGCSHVVTQEMVHKALNSLDQPEQKQFTERCLEPDPASADSTCHLSPASQYREIRQVVQLHAELLEPDPNGLATKLRVQLQLDDLMNRHLTTTLRDEDTGESLAAELVQNGFVSESNSRMVCELLTKVIGARTLQQQQMRASRESSSSEVVATEDQQQQLAPTGKPN